MELRSSGVDRCVVHPLYMEHPRLPHFLSWGPQDCAMGGAPLGGPQAGTPPCLRGRPTAPFPHPLLSGYCVMGPHMAFTIAQPAIVPESLDDRHLNNPNNNNVLVSESANRLRTTFAHQQQHPRTAAPPAVPRAAIGMAGTEPIVKGDK